MYIMHMVYFFFFFQAEDGIRDADVTGVQTCALPISNCGLMKARWRRVRWNRHETLRTCLLPSVILPLCPTLTKGMACRLVPFLPLRAPSYPTLLVSISAAVCAPYEPA